MCGGKYRSCGYRPQEKVKTTNIVYSVLHQNVNHWISWTLVLYFAVNFSLSLNLLQSPIGFFPGFVHLALKYWISILGYIWHIFVWNQTLFPLLFLLRNPKQPIPPAFYISSLSLPEKQKSESTDIVYCPENFSGPPLHLQDRDLAVETIWYLFTPNF